MNVRITPEQLTHVTRRQRELVEARYPLRDELARECDLVMKGGITSGVVYPLAACELARTYRLRQIGGSSAGAIAAVLAAAAEHGRERGGFQRLAALPGAVGATLPLLFKAGPRTREAHGLLMVALEPGQSTSGKTLRMIAAIVRARLRLFLVVASSAVLLTLVALVVAAGWPADPADVVRLVVGVVLLAPIGIVAGLVVTAVAAARSTKRGLDQQGFGICLGSDGASAGRTEPTNLTDWLAATIDEVAGIDGPLTFGDLWGPLDERAVDLQVMTTNLGHRRPMTFPFDTDAFMFDPQEWATYFPPAVMTAMVDASEPAVGPDGQPWCTAEGIPLRCFPAPAAVPVVVAARLSLSFPGLISAVPLYEVDVSRLKDSDRRPVKLWFSDGGITSNFPIHFFDSLWPRRPTFAIDLCAYDQDRPTDDVCWPGHATKGRAPRVRPIADTAAFFSSILDTMQYWADDAQSMLPGYRDRVVEVHLSGHEGGMNLRMSPDVVAVVAEKGRQAAEALDRFDIEQHRWTRFLTAMGELQEAITLMQQRMDAPTAGGGPSYRDLIGQAPDRAHYQRSAAWAERAVDRTDTLLAFIGPAEPDFTDDAPRPDPLLRITPRF